MTTTQDKTRHTSGPWRVGAGNGEGSIFAENGRTRLEVGGTTLYPIAQMGRGWNEAEDEANAKLIAAAPELLDALKTLMEGIEHLDIHGADYARQIITKAEGRDA